VPLQTQQQRCREAVKQRCGAIKQRRTYSCLRIGCVRQNLITSQLILRQPRLPRLPSAPHGVDVAQQHVGHRTPRHERSGTTPTLPCLPSAPELDTSDGRHAAEPSVAKSIRGGTKQRLDLVGMTQGGRLPRRGADVVARPYDSGATDVHTCPHASMGSLAQPLCPNGECQGSSRPECTGYPRGQ